MPLPSPVSVNSCVANVVRIARASVTWFAIPCSSFSNTWSAVPRSLSASSTADRSGVLMPRRSVPTNTMHSCAAVSACTESAVSWDVPMRPWPYITIGTGVGEVYAHAGTIAVNGIW